MALFKSSTHARLMTVSRSSKKAIMVAADLIMLPVALWSAYALRLAEWWPQRYLAEAAWLFVIVPLVGFLVFTKLGLYRAVVRFMSTRAVYAVAQGVVIVALSMYAFAGFLSVDPFPRSVPIIFALVSLVYVGGSRLLVRSYYHWLISRYVSREPVLIYGAGSAGVQLLNALQGSAEYFAVGFIDDDTSLNRITVAGLQVYLPAEIPRLIEDLGVTHLLLALPRITASRRSEILERISVHPIHVKTMPSMAEIVAGEAVDQLRDVDVDDLLGRDPVPPLDALIEKSLSNKAVMVTGAGGSIGSEIARQVVDNGARLLVLFEHSEFALYSIEQELTQRAQQCGAQIQLIPILGSVCDAARINAVLERFAIQTLYHAAAYKHVPIVEHNVLQGLANNTLGTRVVANAALQHGVERFVLISTDKAVRPTNVMGATKRFAELVLQDLAARCRTGEACTVFSMVRFGNVLGSSGSVVPVFKQQIEAGGPVTVTHPEITRYFMTIPEAASLVIQAGSMAEGGDVFVLDMGESVKIVTLAERMIRLMGLSLKSAEDPEGDIEIQFTGLRPGEKLYEELLIGDNVSGTEHPKIMRAEEELLSSEQLEQLISEAQQAITAGDSESARAVIQRAVAGFAPVSENVDWLHGGERVESGIRSELH